MSGLLLKIPLQLRRVYTRVRHKPRLWKFSPSRPRKLVRRTHNLEDEIKLFRFILARKQRLTCQQLSKQTTDRPHIDTRTVFVGAQQELRWAIPERNHAIRISATSFAVRTRQTKVGNLQIAVVVDEQVGALDVAVQNFVPVAVLQPTQKLCHVALNLRLRESDGRRVHETREIVVHVLEDHVDTAFRFLWVVPRVAGGRAFPSHNLFQVDDVLVVQSFEKLDLSNCGQWKLRMKRRIERKTC